MDEDTITKTFSEDFQEFHYTGKERENSCTNFFNSSMSVTSWNHQKQQQAEEGDKFWSQVT